MRVLVIGGTGFTGRRVLRACSPHWTRFALARSSEAAEAVERADFTAVEGDLDEPASIVLALRASRPDAVLCLASLGFGHGPGLVNALVDNGCPRTVFTSTTAIFTKLEPPTKAVRVAAEQAICRAPLPATIVRPTMIYGRPGDRNMERLLRWLRRVPVIAAPAGGSARQQPVHVDDLAMTIVAAIDRPESVGKAINVPGPASLAFSDIVTQAAAAVGRTARLLPVPHRPMRAAVAVQERIVGSPRLKAEQIDRLVEDKSFDAELAAALLGHAPRPFSAGISDEAKLLGLAP